MEIVLSKQALKFLQRQDKVTKLRLIKAIYKLPNSGDIKKLTGKDTYRLRVGDFRIIYDHYGNVIEIIRIANRGQAYK